MIHPSTDDPGGFVLRTELWVPALRAEVFEFFADAFQLETITPPWLHFHVITPRPIEMRAGALIDYTLRLHQIPVRWRTEISVWEPPYRFVDRQLRGPYRYWIHEHTFLEQDGGTLVRDEVKYRVPFGRLVGGIAHRMLVRRDLEKIFTYRQTVMQQRFGSAGV